MLPIASGVVPSTEPIEPNGSEVTTAPFVYAIRLFAVRSMTAVSCV